MKKLFFTIGLLTAALLFFLGWNIWQNNRHVTPPSHTEIKKHFDHSINWLSSNYSTIENIQNPILWWMLKQAAANTQDETLKEIFSNYKKEHLDKMPADLSTPMFNKFYHPRVPDILFLSNLHDYQLFFFYGLSCDKDLGSEPVIQQQMSPGFCSLHYLHPRCITHQLMGLRFMQRYQCGYNDKVQTTINELQDVLLSELRWDFRVGDAYIQRVLMLADTGAYDKIKPVWISNILNAQNKDGSWDDLHPVLHLGDDKVLAFTSTLPKIQKPSADFHTTAQAIWLLSLLLENTKTD